MKSEIVSEKNYLIDEAFGIEITVKVDLDMIVLESSIRQMLKERSYLEQLKKANDREKSFLQKVAMLEGENKRIDQTLSSRFHHGGNRESFGQGNCTPKHQLQSYQGERLTKLVERCEEFPE